MKSLSKEIIIINEGDFMFPILPNGKGWKSTENENQSVIESGEEKVLFSKIIEAIESALQMVCLQSFLIQDTAIIDALLRAVEERGVKVFVLSSAEARLKETIEEEEDFIKASYVQLLDDKFKNHFVHRIAENFHGKYILIDPTTKPKGFICTNNFTYKGFVRNPELAVDLSREQCEELFEVFVYHFWEHSTDEQTETNEFVKVKAANKFRLQKLENILLTSPNSDCNSLNKTLLEAIQKAKNTISFSTFQLDKNTELIKAIIDKAKQGISVKLFCRPIEKQFNEHLKTLLDAGVLIYFHPLIHAKSLLIDRKDGFVFTANLISKGLEVGLEVGVKLNEEQSKDLIAIHQSWQANFPSKAVSKAKVKDLSEIFVFEDRKLQIKILSNNSKEANKKIVTVEDLFSFFDQNFAITDNSIKTLKVTLKAEIEELPKKHKAQGVGKFELLDIDDEKGKKSKLIVVNRDFELSDMDKIQEWNRLKIYYINS